MMLNLVNFAILAGIVLAVIWRLGTPFSSHELLGKLALGTLGIAALFGALRSLESPPVQHFPEVWQTLLYVGALTFLVRRLFVRQKRRAAATVAHFQPKSRYGS